MRLYKMTRDDNKTQGYTLWGKNVTNKIKKCSRPKLCTNTVIHAYKHPVQAAIFNKYLHCEYSKLWVAEGDPVVSDIDKCGVFSLTTKKEIPLPVVNLKKFAKINKLSYSNSCDFVFHELQSIKEKDFLKMCRKYAADCL